MIGLTSLRGSVEDMRSYLTYGYPRQDSISFLAASRCLHE